MALVGTIAIFGNAALAAVLLVAAIGKLVSPREMRAAARELFLPRGTGADFLRDFHVRLFAVIELAAAALLFAPATRSYGAWASAALGVVFAVAGVLATVRGASAPCGCLGSSSAKPLGVRNVGIGLAMTVAAVAVNAAPGVSGVEAAAYSGDVLTISALFALVVCLWANRRRIVPVLRKAW